MNPVAITLIFVVVVVGLFLLLDYFNGFQGPR